MHRDNDAMTDAASPRWRGQPGRLEVWYASATDVATGMGLWLHYELVSPPGADAYVHGWIATFPTDGSPEVVRFGPEPVGLVGADWMRASTASAGPDRLTGSVGGTSWDLAWQADEPPIWTMSAAAWRRELLPSAHVVFAPRARLQGTIRVNGHDYDVDARGSLSHIYGHGNAQRWAWLHADLDDDTSLEVITAVGRRPAMRWLPPMSFVQLRQSGRDWPRNPLAAAPLFRAKLGSPTWSVRGIVGTRRLSLTVTQPDDRCVSLDYTDPDGAHATCTNTEIADARVRIETWYGRWRTEQEWSLDHRAHAERGTRR
jgi:hypothetical protein